MIIMEHVKKSYKKRGRIFQTSSNEILSDVNLHIQDGDCLGIIGESGSGKSTLARILLGLEAYDDGVITIDGLSHKQWLKQNKGKCSVVFQDYRTSVNPNWTIKQIIQEPFFIFNKGKPLTQMMKSSIEALMERVELPIHYLEKYPHELSGGQLQRVCIARALITHPEYLILDEAISSLDVSVQSQILLLLKELQEEYKLTYVFIAHDLQAVAYLCNRLAFLRDGRIIEQLDCNHFTCAQSDYVNELLDSVLPFQSSYIHQT